MKKLLLYYIFLSCSYCLCGQTIKYSYNAAGSCTSRKNLTVQTYSKPDISSSKSDLTNQLKAILYLDLIKDTLNVSAINRQKESAGAIEYIFGNSSRQVLWKDKITEYPIKFSMRNYFKEIPIFKIVYDHEHAVYKVVRL